VSRHRPTVDLQFPGDPPLGPSCRVKLLYRLNNRHLEGIRHPRSPATREMLLQTSGEPRSLQNGCISFRPLWLFMGAR
jgi:hypothetical protein